MGWPPEGGRYMATATAGCGLRAGILSACGESVHQELEDSVAMIRRCDDRDFEAIWAIINDGAQAYKGSIPADRWTEPYMSREKLHHEIDDGVLFWGYEDAGTLLAVMGIQQVQD